MYSQWDILPQIIENIINNWETGVLTIHKSASMAKNRNKKSDEDNNFIMLEGTTKNQKVRMIQLMPKAKVILRKIYASSKWTSENDLIAPTRKGKMNTASNLEHRMKVILNNAGLTNVQGRLHTFRKAFATQMYERGMRVEEIAAYIGDLESTTCQYYIAIRKKLKTKDGVKQVVKIPEIVLGQVQVKMDEGK